ncbi:lysosomal-trafficking regulator-like [Leptidea sinapis]|uniref:lysosomal-trafficking regulator-like n=1 Tax=Leptidea sinapis TaxID=189913 RepID=UPI0021C2B0F0|nr:lysosomal-trafficking regulator-like [Leptidea sinapis]
MVNEACDRPLVEARGGAVRVDTGTGAVLLRPHYLLLLLRAAKHMEREPELEWEEVEWNVSGESAAGRRRVRGSCVGVVLAALRALLRAAHPRRAFNAAHAAAAHTLRHLLDACKERFLNTESGPLSEECSNTLVDVTRALLGSPPLLGDVALLADFLLLMHQASDTFITHSRANFYFLVSTATPEATDFNILQLLGKRNKKRRSSAGRRDLVDRSSASSVSNEDAPGEEEDGLDAAADCKQIKTQLNSHIKDSRKSISSMSENSELTGDRGSGGSGVTGEVELEGGESDQLGDYDVIDEEELSTATNDAYTGALYREAGVRAGAEPGWSACEGLLLLLRDALRATPADQLPQPVGTAVHPEQIVVLANHSSARVRAAVVRLVCALDHRRTHPLIYVHLANQICQYEGSAEVGEACAALLTGRDVPLHDQTHEEVWDDVSDSWCRRACPLLGVLPACMSHTPLACALLAVLARLIDKCSVKALQDVAVGETLVRCVRAAGGTGGAAVGSDGAAAEVRSLLARLTVKVLAGNHSTQMIMDLHNMLTYEEHEAAGRGDDVTERDDRHSGGEGEEGEGEGVVRAARDAQVVCP